MSTKAEKNRNSTRRRSELRRARHSYLIVAAVAIALTVIATSWLVAPRYRATTSLVLDGRTFPVEEGRDARNQVEAFLQTIRDTVAVSLQRPDDTGLAIVDLSTSAASSPEFLSVSATFDVYVDRADARVGERAVVALTEAYLERFRGTSTVPPVSATEFDEARTDLAQAGAERDRDEQTLVAFEHDNAAVLPGLEDVRARVIEETRQERAGVDQQLRTSEIRRNELDSALAEMQRGASQFGNTSDSVLTGEIFTAAQARWAALRGLYGDDYAPAIELGAALSDARLDADARFAAVSAELEEAREGFERLQVSQPLDHPDVIGFAHRVSALERLYEQTRVTALSNRDIRYIEGLARERREIDTEIDDARNRRAALEAQQSEQAQLAERAPILAERHLFLQGQLVDAQRRHESAEAHYAALQDELQAASREQPGELSVAGEAQVNRLALSWPAIAAALICVLCFPVFLFTLRLIERRHRTISGANMITKVQGQPPLAVIPELGRS